MTELSKIFKCKNKSQTSEGKIIQLNKILNMQDLKYVTVSWTTEFEIK